MDVALTNLSLAGWPIVIALLSARPACHPTCCRDCDRGITAADCTLELEDDELCATVVCEDNTCKKKAQDPTDCDDESPCAAGLGCDSTLLTCQPLNCGGPCVDDSGCTQPNEKCLEVVCVEGLCSQPVLRGAGAASMLFGPPVLALTSWGPALLLCSPCLALPPRPAPPSLRCLCPLGCNGCPDA